jgi:hypothetical protein
MFLTADELQTLTGYRRGSAQIRWLVRQGVAHYVRADGKPAVAREAVTGRLDRPGPKWEALRA